MVRQPPFSFSSSCLLGAPQELLDIIQQYLFQYHLPEMNSSDTSGTNPSLHQPGSLCLLLRRVNCVTPGILRLPPG